MDAELHRKLSTLQNRSTAYEIVLTDGTSTVLAWYGAAEKVPASVRDFSGKEA